MKNKLIINQESLNNYSIDILKILALLFMTIDHIGYILYPEIKELRYIGRIAFPLFSFILVYNYIYNSSNKLQYIKRLFYFAIFSQFFYFFIFNLAFQLNIFFTLSLSLYLIYFYETKDTNKNINKKEKIFFYLFLFIISFYMEYNLIGILLIFTIYLFLLKNEKVYFYIILFLLLILNIDTYDIIYNISSLISLVIVICFIYLNEKIQKIKSTKIFNNKYIFYIYYPLHIITIKIISLLKGG